MKQYHLKDFNQKREDENLSFRVFDFTSATLAPYTIPHQNTHFCVLMVEEGILALQVEENKHILRPHKVAVIFPHQASLIQVQSEQIKGKLILFDEVLFCSDILKNELSVYNVNLSTQLNCTILEEEPFKEGLRTVKIVQDIYHHPSLIKKEQARFFIKTFLLSLIESVHGQHALLSTSHSSDQQLYVHFKKLLNERYKTQRTVQYYADQLHITPKKLNTITKKHCGETAIDAIHHRILTEIKRQLMFGDRPHKEIAFDLGFNSPAALNKFVKAKLNETPTQLQQELAQMYNT
ncbi:MULTISPECIES: helix-turn-helix domain-containing protein [Empedobacter]|uniref:Adenosine deaminase n=1 Tax=Empedobacter falsenii TaxID=343874 RepID=A0A376GCV4_9FLAO|nr:MULTISPECIES: helix-turn-helix domain-containing protein [Empedobacter]MDH2208515.1 helix-turn-helix domain-containing protein [Empedobacter sp. GD03644]QLL57901.1 AraC family transcriptional regulator [Empedobacter falsenii]STD58619.1 Adenosine deaminase [Empedobacter falsenii]